MKKYIFLTFFLAPLFVSACVSKSFKGRDNTFTPKSDNYEIESIEQQIDSELSSYPTRFIVPPGEAKQSLDRVFFFFKNYTTSYAPQTASAAARNLQVSNEKSKDKALYRVTRVQVQGGFRYAISASYPKDSRKADLLAANLARFIKEGKIELSYLRY